MSPTSPAAAGRTSPASPRAAAHRGSRRGVRGPAGPPIGRIPVVDVSPVVEGGRWPAKATVGEVVPVRATVFREGHDAVSATAVLVGPDRTDRCQVRMTLVEPGLDRWEARLVPDQPGAWGLRVDGWADPYATWLHDATIKVQAGIDVELMLLTGARLLQRAADRRDRDRMPTVDAEVLREAAAALLDTRRPPDERLAHGVAGQVRAALARTPLRDLLSPSPVYPLVVDRPLAVAGAWYEMFARSAGATYDAATASWRSGTLRTAAEDLPRIAGMGFDVVYLTPVHPIGRSFRKGRNNSMTSEPGDPGSPYAIGSPDGGHDAIEPTLGTFADFDAFVARARSLGMEVALDLALQCSPGPPVGAPAPGVVRAPGGRVRSPTRRTRPRSTRTSTR